MTQPAPGSDVVNDSPAEPAAEQDSAGTASPRPPRAWPWFAAIAVALALIVGLIWVAGGFEPRDDLQIDVAPGEQFQTGPYAFTFSSATIQKTENFSDERVWSVVIIGTGRTTGDESISPDYDDMFVVKDAGSGAYRDEVKSQQFGLEEFRGSSGGSLFTPGLPAIPYRVTFEFPVGAFEPGSSIVFVAWKLEWRDVSLLQIDDFRWAATSDHYRLQLPMHRLADDLE